MGSGECDGPSGKATEVHTYPCLKWETLCSYVFCHYQKRMRTKMKSHMRGWYAGEPQSRHDLAANQGEFHVMRSVAESGNCPVPPANPEQEGLSEGICRSVPADRARRANAGSVWSDCLAFERTRNPDIFQNFFLIFKICIYFLNILIN